MACNLRDQTEVRRELPVPVRIDIRQQGGGIDPDMEDDAIRVNPHAAYFPGVAPAGGYEYPRFGSCICYVPYETHADYGGDLYEDQIRDQIVKHMASGEYPLIRYDGVIPEFISITPLVDSILLQWWKEDPDYTFNLYQSLYKDQGFELVAQIASTGANHTHTVTGLTTGVTYFYYLTALSTTGIEGPKSTAYGVKVL
jgi:hypothetical protein